MWPTEGSEIEVNSKFGHSMYGRTHDGVARLPARVVLAEPCPNVNRDTLKLAGSRIIVQN